MCVYICFIQSILCRKPRGWRRAERGGNFWKRPFDIIIYLRQFVGRSMWRSSQVLLLLLLLFTLHARETHVWNTTSHELREERRASEFRLFFEGQGDVASISSSINDDIDVVVDSPYSVFYKYVIIYMSYIQCDIVYLHNYTFGNHLMAPILNKINTN